MVDQAPSVDEQIDVMLKNGVRFDLVSPDEAKEFLQSSNFFFKIKAFDKNFDKYQSLESPRCGQYVNLDFAYMVDLSRKDAIVREMILDLALDLEHYLKVAINRVLMSSGISPAALMSSFLDFSRQKSFQALKRSLSREDIEVDALELTRLANDLLKAAEDGSSSDTLARDMLDISRLFHKMSGGVDCDHVVHSIERLGESFYSKKLVEKYGDPEKMLPWHFLEMASFGDTVAFYKFMFFDFAEQTAGIDIGDAADLFDAKRIKQFLFPARTLRNAAAHNDCLLHALNYRMKKPLKKIKECLLEECGLERELVENAWKINVVHDFAALLLCFDVVVPGGDTKDRTARGLMSLEESIGLNREFYELQNGVRDALSLMAEISLSFAEKWQSD